MLGEMGEKLPLVENLLSLWHFELREEVEEQTGGQGQCG